MKCFWVFSVALTLSFTAVAAEKNDNVTNVKPSTGRDLYLTCKVIR